MSEQENKASVNDTPVPEGLCTSEQIALEILHILTKHKVTREELNRAFRSVNATLDNFMPITFPLIDPDNRRDIAACH